MSDGVFHALQVSAENQARMLQQMDILSIQMQHSRTDISGLAMSVDNLIALAAKTNEMQMLLADDLQQLRTDIAGLLVKQHDCTSATKRMAVDLTHTAAQLAASALSVNRTALSVDLMNGRVGEVASGLSSILANQIFAGSMMEFSKIGFKEQSINGRVVTTVFESVQAAKLKSILGSSQVESHLIMVLASITNHKSAAFSSVEEPPPAGTAGDTRTYGMFRVIHVNTQVHVLHYSPMSYVTSMPTNKPAAPPQQLSAVLPIPTMLPVARDQGGQPTPVVPIGRFPVNEAVVTHKTVQTAVNNSKVVAARADFLERDAKKTAYDAVQSLPQKAVLSETLRRFREELEAQRVEMVKEGVITEDTATAAVAQVKHGGVPEEERLVLEEAEEALEGSSSDDEPVSTKEPTLMLEEFL
jgi:hypothetical protein